jgi:cellulose biosynthesis protein BcsQ
MKTIALYNLKGGVGKTSACVNLAYCAARDGHKTLLWDMDPQSSATFYLDKKTKLKGGIEKLLKRKTKLEKVIKKTSYENLFIIPSELDNRDADQVLDDMKKSESRLKKVLKELGDNFDYLFIDAPPMITLLSENIFNSAHIIAFPMIPSTLSERTYHQVRDYFKSNDYKARKILPFFNMVDMRRNLHKETLTRFADNDYPTFETYIPASSTVEKMGIHQAPVPTFAPRSKPSSAYKALWKEIKAHAHE